MTYNIDVKCQKGADDQKRDFAINCLKVCKFKSKVCYNKLYDIFKPNGIFIESQVTV